GVRAWRAGVRRLTRPGGRVAAQVALIHGTARADEDTARLAHPRRSPVVALRVRVPTGENGREARHHLDLRRRVVGIRPRGGLDVLQLHLEGDEAVVEGRALVL